jgi:hypothetical protein
VAACGDHRPDDLAVLTGPLASRNTPTINLPGSPCRNSFIRLGSRLLGIASISTEGFSNRNVASTCPNDFFRCRSWRSHCTISDASDARLFLTARLRSRADGAGWPIADLSPDQLDPIIQLVETEMVGACLECYASISLL